MLDARDRLSCFGTRRSFEPNTKKWTDISLQKGRTKERKKELYDSAIVVGIYGWSLVSPLLRLLLLLLPLSALFQFELTQNLI